MSLVFIVKRFVLNNFIVLLLICCVMNMIWYQMQTMFAVELRPCFNILTAFGFILMELLLSLLLCPLLNVIYYHMSSVRLSKPLSLSLGGLLLFSSLDCTFYCPLSGFCPKILKHLFDQRIFSTRDLNLLVNWFWLSLGNIWGLFSSSFLNGVVNIAWG